MYTNAGKTTTQPRRPWYGVSIDHDEAERIGVEVAEVGTDWKEVLANGLAYTPETLRMYTNLADVLPE